MKPFSITFFVCAATAVVSLAFFSFATVSCSSPLTQEIKFMTYNVRSAKGMDNVRDCQRVADVIKKYAPDVLAVQELDSMTNRSGNKYILGELAQLTNMHAEYFPAIEFDGGKYGIGILSVEKPLKVKGYQLPGREEERALLVAEFQNFVFACSHLSLTEKDRLASLAIIESIAKQSTKPFYFAGDLNDVPGSEFLNKLQENFKILNDLSAQTFPSPEPDRTLDYITLYNPSKCKIISTQVPQEPMASDHRPVVVVVLSHSF